MISCLSSFHTLPTPIQKGSKLESLFSLWRFLGLLDSYGCGSQVLFFPFIVNSGYIKPRILLLVLVGNKDKIEQGRYSEFDAYALTFRMWF